MAEHKAFVVPYDLWANEDCSEEALRSFVAPPLNHAMIFAAEQALGVRLPQDYLELAHQQNGGLLQRRYFVLPYSADELEAQIKQGLKPELKVVTLTHLFGIGSTTAWSLCGQFGTNYMVQSWGYPKLGPAIAGCVDLGHSLVFLDYSQHDERVEPQVLLVEKEQDFKRTVLAPTFADFIAQLKTPSELKQAQRAFADACDEVHYKLAALRKEEEAKRVAAQQQAQAQAKEQSEARAKEQTEAHAKEQAEAHAKEQAKAQEAQRQEEVKPQAPAAQPQLVDCSPVLFDLVKRRLNNEGLVHSKHDLELRFQFFDRYRHQVLARIGTSMTASEQAHFDLVDMVQGTGFKESLVQAMINSCSFTGYEGLLRLYVGELIAHHFSPNAKESLEQRQAYEHSVRRDIMALLLCLELENQGQVRNGRYWLHFDDDTWERILGYVPLCYQPHQPLAVDTISPDDVLNFRGKMEGFGLPEPLTVLELVDFINGLSDHNYNCAIMQSRSSTDLPNFELGLPPAFRNDVLTNVRNFMAANYPNSGVALLAKLIERHCYGSCLYNVMYGRLVNVLPQSMVFEVAQSALILEYNQYALNLMRDQVEGQNVSTALYIMGMAYYGLCRFTLEQQRRILLFSKKQEQGLTTLYDNMTLSHPELVRMARETANDIPIFAHKSLEALDTYQKLHADQNAERINLALQAQSYLTQMLGSMRALSR